MSKKNHIKKIIIITLIFSAILFFSDKGKCFNYNTTELRLFSLNNKSKICLKSDVLKNENEYNIYLWTTLNNNKPLVNWPGKEMNNEGNDVYCYVHNDDGEKYDYVIFNGGGKQTIDLALINDSESIINSFIYTFDGTNTSDNKYIGEWRVYDTHKLIEIVDTAKKLKAQDFTIKTYNKVKESLGDNVNNEYITLENSNLYSLKADYISKLTFDNDPLNKLIINYDNNQYTSEYITNYNNLAIALNNLVERKKIVINNSINNGIISASYEDGYDNKINIDATPITGYEIKSFIIKKIKNNDFNNPISINKINIDTPNLNNTKYNYVFDEADYDTDDYSTIYIDAEFKKKTYKLSFIVGENGQITTIDEEQILSPITIEHDDKYDLIIKENPGYEVDEIIINDNIYSLQDNMLSIKNIQNDIVVNISFKLKSYKIKIDNKDYYFNYNTTYEEIIFSLNIDKNKYSSLNLIDKAGNIISKDYVVNKNDEFFIKFKEKEIVKTDTSNNSKQMNHITNNPYTGDKFLKYLFLSIVSIIMIIILFKIKNRCKNK